MIKPSERTQNMRELTGLARRKHAMTLRSMLSKKDFEGDPSNLDSI
jgi:hypothetical protein